MNENKVEERQVFGYLHVPHMDMTYALLSSTPVNDWEDGLFTFRFLCVPYRNGKASVSTPEGVYPYSRMITVTAPFQIAWVTERIKVHSFNVFDEESALGEDILTLEEPDSLKEIDYLDKEKDFEEELNYE